MAYCARCGDSIDGAASAGRLGGEYVSLCKNCSIIVEEIHGNQAKNGSYCMSCGQTITDLDARIRKADGRRAMLCKNCARRADDGEQLKLNTASLYRPADSGYTAPKNQTYVSDVSVNPISILIKGIAVLSFIVSIVLFFGAFDEELLWPYCIAAFISGSILFGFGEIIKLLHEINERQKRDERDRLYNKK